MNRAMQIVGVSDTRQKDDFYATPSEATWKLLDVNGNQYGEMIEDSNALVRRFVPFGKWIPARYHMEIPGTAEITLNQLFNPFIRRTVVTIPQGHQIDRRVLAGIALLNASIEGRQSS